MGTLSKRGIEDFGDDIKEHIDELRSRVGKKLDEAAVAGSELAAAQAFDNSVGTSKPAAVGGSLGETGSSFGRVLEDAAETAGDTRPELAAGGAQLVDESGATVGVAKEAASQREAKLVDENGTPIGHAKAASQARIPRGRIPVSDQSDIRRLLEDTERSSPYATESGRSRPRARGTESSRDSASKTGRESRAVGSQRSPRSGQGDMQSRDTRPMDLRRNARDMMERDTRPVGTRRNARSGDGDAPERDTRPLGAQRDPLGDAINRGTRGASNDIGSTEWSPYRGAASPKKRGRDSTSDPDSTSGRDAMGAHEGLDIQGGAVGIGERIAHQIERVMVGVPSATWMTLAGASLISSLALRLLGRRATANLLSGWAPTFLVCGLYHKLTTVGAATALLSSRR